MVLTKRKAPSQDEIGLDMSFADTLYDNQFVTCMCSSARSG